jgi:stage II sporulation protein Q
MKAKRLKLKRWASTAIYISLIMIVFISMMFVSNVLDQKYGDTLNMSYILKDFIDTDTQVVNVQNEGIIKPFDSENVVIDINYYEKDSDEETQQKSLILYENTYMPNTGILYSNNEQFDCITTLDGTVTKISKDELLGNVIEITHSSSLITTYYSIDNINVSEGQSLKQGDIIGTSGKNNISSTSDNMLLFEVSLNGNNINPENYYQTKLEDLQG